MAGWGRCRRSKALSLPGGARARLPTGGPVRGRGSRPPARRDRSTWRGTVAGPSSRPQVPSSSLALCLCGGGRAAGKCGPRESARSSGWQGGLPLTLTPAQGPCGPGLISQGGGTLPGGMLLGWGLLAPARPRLLARNHPAAARTKVISWGPPPCSSIRKGVPRYGWKNRGEAPRRWLLSEPRLGGFRAKRRGRAGASRPPHHKHPSGQRARPLRYQARFTGSLGRCQS